MPQFKETYMKEGLLLVDYENVGQVELETIPEEVHVLFFFGASQRSVPRDC